MKAYFQKVSEDATLPTRGSEQAAGYDLHASHNGFIDSGQTMVVETGLIMRMRNNRSVDYDADGNQFVMVGMVCSRSGLAAKHSVFVANAPGIIDQDYQGEIKVILHNAGTKPFNFNRGDRIAQLLFMSAFAPQIVEVDEVTVDSKRGAGGLGSTGVGKVIDITEARAAKIAKAHPQVVPVEEFNKHLEKMSA